MHVLPVSGGLCYRWSSCRVSWAAWGARLQASSVGNIILSGSMPLEKNFCRWILSQLCRDIMGHRWPHAFGCGGAPRTAGLVRPLDWGL